MHSVLYVVLFIAERVPGNKQETATEVLKHQPGALCALIEAVLDINDGSAVRLHYCMCNV